MVLHTPITPAHSKLRQEDHGFEISLDYKKKKKNLSQKKNLKHQRECLQEALDYLHGSLANSHSWLTWLLFP